MKLRNTFTALLWTATLVLSFGLHAADSQQAAPKKHKGFKATVMQVVDLGPEIDGMTGRQLRLRQLVIEPGGHIGIHSHKDRPAVAYFLKGTDTVTLEDGTVKVFRPGDSTFAAKGTMHWHRNDGNEPVVLVTVDVFHKTK